MPGGLLPLVAFGKQNVVINGNPQITFFYKTFKKHSHFSEENITIPLEGPQELNLDASIKIKAKIPRFADLVRSMSLRVRLPDIYSKLYEETIEHEFKWVRHLGTQIIDRAVLLVGGAKIQELTGEWISLQAQMDLPQEQYAKWRHMIGDVEELYDPVNGLNAEVDEDGKRYYPNVQQTSAQQQNNMPSISGRHLLIPLPFWFSSNLGNALPVGALKYHEVEVQIYLKPLRDLYTIRDKFGSRVRFGYESIPSDEIPETLNVNYNSTMDPLGAPQNFYVDYGVSLPMTEYFNLEPTLQVGYVYLSDTERKWFSGQTLKYLLTQNQVFHYPGITTRTKLDIDAHNMVRRMVWLLRRNDALVYRNDALNCTNWKYANKKPYIRGLGVPTASSSGRGSSGLNFAGSNRSILRTARILCQGNQIFEEKNAEFYEQQQPYDNIVGGVEPKNIGMDTFGPLYLYSFATKASDLIQPSGSINLSQINNFQLEIDVEPIPANANYKYDLTLYMESMNSFSVISGRGGLEFAV